MNKIKSSYDRNEELKKEFNTFWSEWQNKKGQLTQDMPLNSIILLKSALRNINNIATLKVTELLVDELVKLFPKQFKEIKKDILDGIRKESPNANGYDIQFESAKISFLAEIKCNVPFQKDKKGWKFGANQAAGIKKDIESLRQVKPKAELKKDIRKYYKFLGIYDYEGRSEDAIARIQESIGVTQHEPILPLRKGIELKSNAIYIVMLGGDSKQPSP